MSDYIIHEETLNNIADAVRKLRYEKQKMTPAQIIEKILDTRIGVPIEIKTESHIDPLTGKWERPIEWPDLDSLTIEDNFDGVYLLYDLNKIQTPFISIFCQLNLNGNYKLERGHIENGLFIIDDTIIKTHNTYIRQTLNPENGNFQIFRIIPDDINKKIIRIGFGASEDDDTSTCLANCYQPCIERIGRLDYLKTMESTPNSRNSSCWITGWLERDYIRCDGKNTLTSMSRAYDGAVSLQEVYVDWNTSSWTVSSLYRLFASCISLENIIGIENWDTSNWEIKDAELTAFFYCCTKLKHIPIGGWNTSKWHPTTLQNTFTYCRNLLELDLSNWDVSKFKPTSLYIMFMNCESLISLDISTWDTSSWPVTNMQYLFSGCTSLQKININGWDVSNWRPKSIYNLFGYCRSLKEIDLSNWDVSNWSPTNCGSLFNQCYSLQKVKTGWNTSNWAITTSDSLFSNCYSLKEQDIDQWDVSNWAPTSMSNMFGNCCSLTKVDLSKWDCSNWTITRIDTLFGHDYNLQTIILPVSLDLSNVTNVTDIFRNITMLQNINKMGVPMAVNYSEMQLLSAESIIGILESLPTVSTATTITFGANNLRKITAEQIAVATQKGWTVA